jgi:hypothetical protein
MVVRFYPWPLHPRYQFSRTVYVFQFLFACSLQYKILLPQSDIELSPLAVPTPSPVTVLRLPQSDTELSSLAVPTHSPVTVLRLPQLNSSNGRTALMFQIVLIVQGRSWWGQQQLLTGWFVQGFEFDTWSKSEKFGYRNVRLPSLFCAYAWKESKDFLSYNRAASPLSAVQLTVRWS